ncbi:alpha-1,3-mannosyl-glycoprotein 4-beta-N-acetylglucosaminyltransferase C-like [Petromyzon marinus]|uniref:Alpha-1,3-mannosyl-glycoprotein 4-beta-N-acetylglucosaminyltransferase C-like n=1 Tax=Petromyzon marinus TaxID=7757 RepID=A0AAJ7SSC4_PETMA|nr:alpha-1,3-mannosyl-glycoprotein 4-beta-N-acetylglucosaminyltransferase C-like [Petromyzon marinus]XP_032804686.1 alpha-1,3-mannosyl-glycoprotein 4-beta-N-acetylglucosaminyltransferase C-like [Petromyzon marinus]
MRLQWKCGRVLLLFTIVVSLVLLMAFVLSWEQPYKTSRRGNSPVITQELLDIISEASHPHEGKATSRILMFNTTRLIFSNITEDIFTTEKKFLAIGLCSVNRKHEPYLIDTLRSIFEQSSSTELQQMVVVVHLCDFDMAWCEMTARLITKMFPSHMLAKRLLLIHAPEEIYPSLEGLKANYNDPPDRVRFRSKQNLDYSFLIGFCANLADYYIMLEDDLKCANNFLTTIQKAIASRKNKNWVTLEFSKLGYIGKLYHGNDLPTLAQFLFLFYQEMPCDWLLTHFRVILTQNNPINFKPALFQHMGLYSSFRGNRNELKDGDFQESTANVADNPAATFHTSIKVFEDYRPEKAYSTESGYFWGKTPVAGDYFMLKFVEPQNIDVIEVLTSSFERKNDGLKAGLLQVGTNVDKQSCLSFITLGHFVHGEYRERNISTIVPFKIGCIRINVTMTQTEWIIIRSISIWVAHKEQ